VTGAAGVSVLVQTVAAIAALGGVSSKDGTADGDGAAANVHPAAEGTAAVGPGYRMAATTAGHRIPARAEVSVCAPAANGQIVGNAGVRYRQHAIGVQAAPAAGRVVLHGRAVQDERALVVSSLPPHRAPGPLAALGFPASVTPRRPRQTGGTPPSPWPCSAR